MATQADQPGPLSRPVQAKAAAAWGAAVGVVAVAASLNRLYGLWWAAPLLAAGVAALLLPSRQTLLAVAIALGLVALTGLPAGGRQPWLVSAILATGSLLAVAGVRGIAPGLPSMTMVPRPPPLGGAAGGMRSGELLTVAGVVLGFVAAAALVAVWAGLLPILPWIEVSLGLGQSALALSAAAAAGSYWRGGGISPRTALALVLAAMAVLPLVWLLFLAP